MTTFPPDDSEFFYKPPMWAKARLEELKEILEDMKPEDMKPENMYITAAKALAKVFDIEVSRAVVTGDGKVYLRTNEDAVYECVIRDELKETRLAHVSWIATKRIPALVAQGFFS